MSTLNFPGSGGGAAWSLPPLRGGAPVSGGSIGRSGRRGGGAGLPLGEREGGLAGRSEAEAGNNKQSRGCA
jgi:hypothetical protein